MSTTSVQLEGALNIARGKVYKGARLLTFIDWGGIRVKLCSTQYVPRLSRCAFFLVGGAEPPIFAARMTLQINAVIVFIEPSVIMSVPESSNSCVVPPVHKSVSILSAPKCINVRPVGLVS
jgi:hypothetical protein